MSNPITAIRNLYSETVAEMKKCTWPTKHDLYESTSVVLTSLVIITVVVMCLSWAFQWGVGLIAGMN